jgi:pyridoxal phosphate-dependent aminotransferase EpsN
MSGAEERLVQEAFASNWLSTGGPHVEAFEQEMSARIGVPGVAVSSGTAAIHLGLRLLGVGPGDEVVSPTLTFVASVNPIAYLGARPVFIDSERESWNLDPQLLSDLLEKRAAANRLPRAVIVVHLYGQSANLDPILEVCDRYEVPVLEDAAEALGATYRGKTIGSCGAVSALSFNGNKIITTTAGGMVLSPGRELVSKARFWASQARDQGIGYEHSEVGYNYGMSNLLAAVGRAQLKVLDERIQQRCAVFERYRSAFASLPGIEPMPQPDWGGSTRWLSCFLIQESQFGATRDDVLGALDRAGIEARPVWKPMHLQALWRGTERIGGGVADDLFARGICLPSSSSLSSSEHERVVDCVRALHRANF